MSRPIYFDSRGGNIGRFHWVNSDTRRTCSGWVFWGDWWWATVGNTPYLRLRLGRRLRQILREQPLSTPAFWDGDYDKSSTPGDQ